MITVLFAYSSKSEIELLTSVITIFVFIIVAVIAVVVKSVAESNAQKANIKQTNLNHRRFLDWQTQVISNGGNLSEIPVEIPLKSGEHCFFACGSQLCEPRAVRKSRHTGSAVRIARGVSIGRGYTTSEAHEEWRTIATGTLYITNQRIIFDGDMQSRNIKFADLVSSQNGGTCISVASATRQKTMVFNNINGYIASTIINSIKNSQR